MSFHEDMYSLLKTGDWQACHRRIDAEPDDTREARAEIAGWRSLILEREGRYEAALRVNEASKADVFTECGRLFERAQILCNMGKFPEAIETLRGAPFGEDIETFPGITWEAIFLYCRLLLSSGRQPPPNLLAALPDDFKTFTWDRRFMSKADLLSEAERAARPA